MNTVAPAAVRLPARTDGDNATVVDAVDMPDFGPTREPPP